MSPQLRHFLQASFRNIILLDTSTFRILFKRGVMAIDLLVCTGQSWISQLQFQISNLCCVDYFGSRSTHVVSEMYFRNIAFLFYSFIEALLRVDFLYKYDLRVDILNSCSELAAVGFGPNPVCFRLITGLCSHSLSHCCFSGKLGGGLLNFFFTPKKWTNMCPSVPLF